MNPFEFIQFTPKSNCGRCGHPTCLAFAVAVTKGGADPAGCPHIDPSVLPLGGLTAEGEGLEQVARGQEERDMALVVHLKSKIRSLDFFEIAPRLGALWTNDRPDQLFFCYLGRDVELGKEAVRLEGRGLIDPRDQILLYNYVASGGGLPPEGVWVGMESLPNSISKVRTLAAYCEDPLSRRFCGRPDRLAELCAKIGASLTGEGHGADFAAVIPVLPFVPLSLLFWDEAPEDGFASRVKVLFDHHVLDFLDIESLVFAAERMAELLLELDS